MSHDDGFRIVFLQLLEELHEAAALGFGTGVGWLAILVQAPFITDADGVLVTVQTVGSDH